MRTSQSESLLSFYRGAARLARLMALKAENELPPGMTMSRFELLDLLAAQTGTQQANRSEIAEADVNEGAPSGIAPL